MTTRRGSLAALGALALGGLPLGARAQAGTPPTASKYPSRPIRFVVPFAAGGGGDIVARLLANRIADRNGVTTVVENRVGAGGNIGADFVLKSPPDGYTLLNMSSTYPIQAAVSKLPFDPIGDMEPIAMISRDPSNILVRAQSPFASLRDLLAAARREPGKLTHGSAGVGSLAHLAMEEFAHLAGVKLTHVPYKGTSQAMTALLSGEIDMIFSSATFTASQMKAKRARGLAVVGTERLATLPEVPTFSELGVPGYRVYDWKAVAGPKGMPREVIAWLNTELNAILREPAMVERFTGEGAALVGGPPEVMLATIRGDIARWKTVAEMTKVKVE